MYSEKIYMKVKVFAIDTTDSSVHSFTSRPAQDEWIALSPATRKTAYAVNRAVYEAKVEGTIVAH
jgi:hypothetical protein